VVIPWETYQSHLQESRSPRRTP